MRLKVINKLAAAGAVAVLVGALQPIETAVAEGFRKRLPPTKSINRWGDRIPTGPCVPLIRVMSSDGKKYDRVATKWGQLCFQARFNFGCPKKKTMGLAKVVLYRGQGNLAKHGPRLRHNRLNERALTPAQRAAIRNQGYTATIGTGRRLVKPYKIAVPGICNQHLSARARRYRASRSRVMRDGYSIYLPDRYWVGVNYRCRKIGSKYGKLSDRQSKIRAYPVWIQCLPSPKTKVQEARTQTGTTGSGGGPAVVGGPAKLTRLLPQRTLYRRCAAGATRVHVLIKTRYRLLIRKPGRFRYSWRGGAGKRGKSKEFVVYAKSVGKTRLLEWTRREYIPIKTTIRPMLDGRKKVTRGGRITTELLLHYRNEKGTTWRYYTPASKRVTKLVCQS